MILAFDTYYFEGRAKTVCLAFEDWTADDSTEMYSEILDGVEEYTPGEFYKRELPCILSLLKKVRPSRIEAIVVDGFVFVDDHLKPGLGGHLYQALGGAIPVIGVAKTNFATVEKNKRPLLRGHSERPLFITAIGIDVDEAMECIRNMRGNYRVPTILKKLDQLTREQENA